MSGTRLEQGSQREIESAVPDEHHAAHAPQHLLRERLAHKRIGHHAQHLQLARIVERKQPGIFVFGQRIAVAVVIYHAVGLPERIVHLFAEHEIALHLAVIEQAFARTLLKPAAEQIGQIKAQNQDGGEHQQHSYNFRRHIYNSPLLNRRAVKSTETLETPVRAASTGRSVSTLPTANFLINTEISR